MVKKDYSELIEIDKETLYYKTVDIVGDREITVRELIESELMEIFDEDYMDRVDKLDYNKLVKLLKLLGFENLID